MFAFIYNNALPDNSYNDLIFCVACVLLVVEIVRNEVAKTAMLRQKAKDTTPLVGYKCGDTPPKHRCVRPKDAKMGNLVLLDVRNAGKDQAALLGEWDGRFQLGTVSTRQVRLHQQCRQCLCGAERVSPSSGYVGAVLQICRRRVSSSQGGKRPSSKEWRCIAPK